MANPDSELSLIRTMGFNGAVTNGLQTHPDGQHIIYSLGSTIVIQNLKSKNQIFLRGHTNTVSCITVSPSGRFIASGQETHMGFKADIIVWDYETKQAYCTFTLHKVRVEALSFSSQDKYLVSLGGQDDGSVVVWSIERKESICGEEAAIPSAGNATVVQFASVNENQFVTAGDLTLRVWQLDVQNRKIRPTECQMGLFKRCIKCIEISSDDSYFLAGTTSGDILKMNMQTCKLIECGPDKDHAFSRGVNAVKILDNDQKNLIISTGAGRVALVKEAKNGKKYPSIQEFQVDQKVGTPSISSLAVNSSHVYVGTSQAEVYKLQLKNGATWSDGELFASCHHKKINDVAFAANVSELFATCGNEDIRIWDAKQFRELSRIRRDNLVCNAIAFSPDGHSLVSAWNDNKIRAFGPQSGQQIYKIDNAHNLGVTALAITPNSRRIISGGGDGQVRVWDLTLTRPYIQELKETMKEHKSKVSCIKIKSNGLECVSSSEDGTVIIWDLTRFVRLQMVMANTLFECVSYHPDENQILTSGTDRKVAYWETYDGNQIRELDASNTGGINGLDIDSVGQLFSTGGDDTILKVWDYQAGSVVFLGVGHADAITKVKFSPDRKFIVSVSADGGILVWKLPF